MNWRPKDWQNPYKDKEGCWEYQCFERGADAMLKALLDKGLKVKNIGDRPRVKGIVIFIPDEE